MRNGLQYGRQRQVDEFLVAVIDGYDLDKDSQYMCVEASWLTYSTCLLLDNGQVYKR